MQCPQALQGFSSSGIPSHGLSSLTITRRLAGAGMYISRKQELHNQGIVLSFLRHQSRCKWENPESSRSCGNKSIPLCWWKWEPNILNRYKESCTRVAAISSDYLSDDGQGGLLGKQIGHVLLCAALLTVACASLFLSKNMALAAATADPSLSRLPSLVQQSKDGLSLLWPKCLQVLAVFRDQGLLLSLLLGLSAFFSMAETAITTLWPWKVRSLLRIFFAKSLSCDKNITLVLYF